MASNPLLNYAPPPKEKNHDPWLDAGVSPERYNALVAACRRFPMDKSLHSNVAKLVGIRPETLKQLWWHGWQEQSWAPPIRGILMQEQRLARKQLLHNENFPQHQRQPMVPEPSDAPPTKTEQDKERELAAQSRAQEARLIGTARGNVIALQAILARCLRGGLTLAESIENHFRTGDVTPKEAFRFIRNMGELVQSASTASKYVLEAERLRVGLPQAIIGFVPIDGLTPDQAVADIARASNAMERARRNGLVSLPSGQQVQESKLIEAETLDGERTGGISLAEGHALDTLFDALDN